MRALLLLLAGCGLSDDELERLASERVQAALAEPQTCSVDEDCEIIGLSGSCFDLCWGVIATSNRGPVQAAMAEAESEYCADYTGTFIRPPCVPPGEAACGDDGMCTER
ncbi:MAG: hypothetical protein KC656_35300 [Myxococcales bacterium]|nr:hypothetical protein [Myxococcales bacterium]MCA9573173.1 hypothetical protein [Myxococcales bacterium]MCB9693891.1 hypothetical protein [Alphaproteobacteria bacterium]